MNWYNGIKGMKMADLEKWLQARAKKDKELYWKYGRPLEKLHKGKLAAIAPDGRVILGRSDVTLTKKAIKRFGSGNFAFVRIGYPYVGKWLKLLQR